MSDSGDGNQVDDLIGVLVATGLQGGISLALMAGFSFLRPRNKIVYEPRSKFAPENKRPEPLKWYPTAWLRPTLFTNENQLVDKIGLDAVMFLRFLRFCVQFFLGLCAFGIPLCIFHSFAPKIIGQSNNDEGNVDEQNGKNGEGKKKVFNPKLSSLSMNQVFRESPWFWLHASLVYLFSLYAYYLLNRLWNDWISFRQAYFSTQEFQQSYHNRTLLLTNLPDDMQTPEAVANFIQSCNLKYPMRQAVIGRSVGDLHKLVEEHRKETARMEDALAIYLADPHGIPSKRPTHKINKTLFILGGQKVDSIEYCSERLHQLESQIYDLRSKGDSFFKPNASAFVSFPSVKAAASAASKLDSTAAIILRSGMANAPSVKLSPDFDDIIWQNLGITPTVRRTRQLISLAIVIGVTIFWTLISSFVSGLTSLGTIQRYVPALADWIARHNGASAFLSSVVAPVLLAVLQILPPIGFRFLGRFSSVLSTTGVEKSVMHRFFAFSVYQYAVIVLSIVSVSTIGTLVTKSRQEILREASVAFMDKSSFFIAMLVTGMTSMSIELIQGVPLVLGFIKRKLLANTPRKEFEYNQPPALPYGPIYAALVIKFLLGVCYSVAAPLILPFTALFFFIAYLVYKYQLIYVYETPLETGGTWWPKVFNLICICLGIFQLMTLGAILLITGDSENGNGKKQGSMVIAMLIFNAVYWWACRRWIAPKGQFVSKSDVEIVDDDEMDKYRADDEALEDRVYNPALVKPLWRVWVWKQSRELLNKYYEPEYVDLADYIQKQRGTATDDSSNSDGTIRRNNKRVISFLQRHPIHATSPNTEAPPELQAVAREIGADLPVLVAADDLDDMRGSVLPSYSRDASVPRAADHYPRDRPYELHTYNQNTTGDDEWADVRTFKSTEDLNPIYDRRR